MRRNSVPAIEESYAVRSDKTTNRKNKPPQRESVATFDPQITDNYKGWKVES